MGYFIGNLGVVLTTTLSFAGQSGSPRACRKVCRVSRYCVPRLSAACRPTSSCRPKGSMWRFARVFCWTVHQVPDPELHLHFDHSGFYQLALVAGAEHGGFRCSAGTGHQGCSPPRARTPQHLTPVPHSEREKESGNNIIHAHLLASCLPS